MNLYRYMSEEEFQTLMKGERLIHNLKEHDARTNSRGFCFLPEVIEFQANSRKWYKYTPERCFDFLYGIIYPDAFLVEFEVLNEEALFKGYGTYADPTNDIWGDLIDIDEYSLMEYDQSILKPLRLKKSNGYDFVHSEWVKL